MRVLIIGCGYVGLALGERLAREGHEVFGLRRTRKAESELLAASINPLYADISKPRDLELVEGDFDGIVNLVSSGKGGLEEYKRTYLEGTRNVLEWLRGRGVRHYVHASSTSVYGQQDGSVVDEESATTPASATSSVLVEAERTVLQGSSGETVSPVVLRVAGIYGPGRGHLFRQFMRGEAKLTGAGERFLNMIHLEDVAGIICAVLMKAPPPGLYNAVDDEPVQERVFYEWLAAQTGLPMPEKGSGETGKWRKRGHTNKRVSNARLKSVLGYEFRFPTFREGFKWELERTNPEKEVPRA